MKYFLIVSFWAFLWSNSVLAHTALTQSTPADGEMLNLTPEMMQLEFTESVRLLRAELKVIREGESIAVELEFKPSSNALQKHSVTMPTLENGQYTFSWSVIGADGHPVQGAIAFGVGMQAKVSSDSHAHNHSGH